MDAFLSAPFLDLDLTAPLAPLSATSTTTTINYVYDPLYRLTEANYNDGRSFHYTYDAVGNRLTETVDGGTPTSYTYDVANRMTTAGGVTYTYDDNGNMLNDGVNTYTSIRKLFGFLTPHTLSRPLVKFH